MVTDGNINQNNVICTHLYSLGNNKTSVSAYNSKYLHAHFIVCSSVMSNTISAIWFLFLDWDVKHLVILIFRIME